MESNTAGETTDDLLQCLPIANFFAEKSQKGDLNSGVLEKTKLRKNWTLAGDSVPYLYENHPVAIKYAAKTDAKKCIKREYELLSQLRNPNVVSVYEWCDKYNPSNTNSLTYSFFVMESGQCSLNDFLHGTYAKAIETARLKSADSMYSEKELSSNYTMNRCLVWLSQMANGMEYLHEKGILHRDVKSDNVLLFDYCQTCKICDLDVGRRDEGEERKTKGKGTDPYAAPEVNSNLVDSNGRVVYSFPADYYSFGVLMNECLSRKDPTDGRPFNKIPTESTFGSAADVRYKFKMMKQCIEKQQKKPEERMNFTLIKSTILASCLPTKDMQLANLPLPSKDELKKKGIHGDAPLPHRGSGKTTCSKPRPGQTIFYNVKLEDAGELKVANKVGKETQLSMDKKTQGRISELLTVSGQKINIRVLKSPKLDAGTKDVSSDVKSVEHKFRVQMPMNGNQFCEIEHVIQSNSIEAEDAVYKYCCEDANHLKWFEGLFLDEPEDALEKLRFTVKLDNSDILPNISAGTQPE